MQSFLFVWLTIAAPPLTIQSWSSTDGVAAGWDWSLPPTTLPVPNSGVLYGDRYNRPLPGNRIVHLSASWRELEPEEGQFRFELLRERLDAVTEPYVGCELHVYGAVWETRYLDNGRITKGVAPRWLVDRYDVPIVEERPMTNIGTPFQVVNLDIFHDAYHAAYLRFVRAFGDHGLARHPKLKLAYLHASSASRGEEAWGSYQGRQLTLMKERLAAWAEAFRGGEGKLAWVGHTNDLLPFAYSLGMGQRNGFVEMYLMHVDNRDLGQYLDPQGYLTVDETCPPIAESRAFGDENEEYSVDAHVSRFGPAETFPHRYRESMLRTLQMRRNYVWAENTPWVDPPLLAYVSLALGRTVADTPDIWCYLRESYVGRQTPRPVKNFERWLYQRDADGARTTPAVKVDIPDKQFPHHPAHKYDYIARQTDRASGNEAIQLAVDDRFLSDGPHQVVVKVTYHDLAKGTWALVYQTPTGEGRRDIEQVGDGQLKTVTWWLGDAVFSARGTEPDLSLRAGSVDVVASFVRLIKP